MFRPILSACACLLATHLWAMVVEVNLPYPEIRLKDGTLFTEPTVKSFNPAAGTATLLMKKVLISLPVSLLPDEVALKLKDLAPVLTKEELEGERQKEAALRQQSAENAARRQKQAEEEDKAARADTRLLNVKAAEQALARSSSGLDEVAKFAETQARIYFKYRDDPHSNIGAVIASDLTLENPEPVPGWSGRYRVTGSAYRQYVNNQASGFGRGGKEFEMLIQTSEREKPQLIEIQIK